VTHFDADMAPPGWAGIRDGHPGTWISAAGSAGPGITWWVLQAATNADGRTATTRPDAAQLREQRRRILTGLLGDGAVRWRCPDCGSSEHGRPTWELGSVSTSDIIAPDRSCQWLALAVGPAELSIGIDIVALNLPKVAARAMLRYLTPREQELAARLGAARMWARKESLAKARGTGLLGQLSAAAPDGPLDTLAGGVNVLDIDPSDLAAVRVTALLGALAWVSGP
jgi:hypothetical protein